MKIETSKRKASFANLSDFCIHSMGPERKDKGDFLEVTEWTNREGYDIHISDISGERQFYLTWGQVKALKKCIKAIEEYEQGK